MSFSDIILCEQIGLHCLFLCMLSCILLCMKIWLKSLLGCAIGIAMAFVLQGDNNQAIEIINYISIKNAEERHGRGRPASPLCSVNPLFLN